MMASMTNMYQDWLESEQGLLSPEEERYRGIWSSAETKIADMFEQLLMGDFTDKVSVEGVIGQILLGFTGVDFIADARDVVANVMEGDATGVATSAVGLLPIIGAIRYADEVETVIRGAKKESDLLRACNCFVGGIEVQTDEGEKNIEDIEVGDRVLAKDENNPDGELAYKEVTGLYRNQRDDIIKLFVGEQVIETTENHPFWVEEKGWVFADELKVGDKLQKADGSNLTIDKVEFVKLDEPVTVYNFTVADFHTYYVTDLGIWVHNTKCGPNGKFENADYHGKTNNSVKNKAPNDGQKALDNSISIGPNTDRRIGISDGEFVVLDKTSDGLYHGHVRSWGELDQKMQSIFRKAGLVDKKGNIK